MGFLFLFWFGNRFLGCYMSSLPLLGNLNIHLYMYRSFLRIRFLVILVCIRRCNIRLCLWLFFRCRCIILRMNILYRCIRNMILGFHLCNMYLIVMGRSNYFLHLLRLHILMMGCRRILLRSNMLRLRLLMLVPLFLLMPIRLLLFL